MKKKIRNILLGLVACLVLFVLVFVGVNLFDAGKPEGEYSLSDLPPASLKSGNGYFTLMTLSYPPDSDITSQTVIDQISGISRPELLALGADRYYDKAKPFRDLSNSLECTAGDLLVTPFADNFDKQVESRDKLQQWFATKPLLMERYATLLAAAQVEDFSLPLYTYPIPQLHNLMQAANLYTARHILNAVDGGWQQGTAGILAQLAFARKYCAGSRQQINKMVAYRLLKTNLKALAYIMHQPECPGEICAQVLTALPALKEEEISLKTPIIFEYLMAAQGIADLGKSKGAPFDAMKTLSAGILPSTTDWMNFLSRFGIFLDRNRTMQYYLAETNKLLQYEQKPPFTWQKKLAELTPFNPTAKTFWWFKNPLGKVVFAISYKAYQNMIYEKYEVQALGDMVRIAAELQQSHSGDATLDQVLTGLAAYRARDPFSGNAYLLDTEKQHLYSARTDKQGQHSLFIRFRETDPIAQ